MCLKNGVASALSITELKVLKTSCEVIEKIDTLGLDVGRLSGVGGRLTPLIFLANKKPRINGANY